MDRLSEQLIAKLAKEAFEIAAADVPQQRAQGEREVLAAARGTGNIASYPDALVKLAGERAPELFLAGVDAYLEVFTTFGLPADDQAEKFFETSAVQIEAGVGPWVQGQLDLYRTRTRNAVTDPTGHLNRTVQRAMSSAKKKLKFRLEQQRLMAKAAKEGLAVMSPSVAVANQRPEPPEPKRTIQAALREAWRLRAPVQRVEDILRPFVPGAGDARGKPFWDDLWAYLRRDSSLQMERPEFDNLNPEDILALLRRQVESISPVLIALPENATSENGPTVEADPKTPVRIHPRAPVLRLQYPLDFPAAEQKAIEMARVSANRKIKGTAVQSYEERKGAYTEWFWSVVSAAAPAIGRAANAQDWEANRRRSFFEDVASEVARAAGMSKSAFLETQKIEEWRELDDCLFDPDAGLAIPSRTDADPQGRRVAKDQATADRAASRQAVVMPILKSKRWKPGRLATTAGLGKNSVYQYLDGTRSRITTENRTAIAEALGLEAEQLPD